MSSHNSSWAEPAGQTAQKSPPVAANEAKDDGGVRLAGLDALRGIAILLVLLRHALPGTFGTSGIIGVVVFFTLSGYLISGILQRDLIKFRRIRYGRFYFNRAFRLIPALAVFLLVFILITVLVDDFATRNQAITTVVAGALYFANAPGLAMAPGTSHLWTLATEEQFYLVWPTLLALAVTRGKLKALFVAAAVAWLILLTVTASIAPNAYTLYQLPTTWFIALCMGAWLSTRTPHAHQIKPIFAALALVTLLFGCFIPDPKGFLIGYYILAPVVGALACVLIAYAVQMQRLPAALKALTWLGKISYSAYLWNFLIVVLLEWLGITQWLVALTSIPLTLLLAAASWYFVERPAMTVRDKMWARVAQTKTPVTTQYAK